MLAAVLDRDVSKANLLKYPTLYQSGIRQECFNVQLLLRIILEGVAHSIVLYFGCLLLFTGAGDVVKSDGQTHDLWVISTAMYSYLVLIVNLRLGLDTTTWTWVNFFFFFGSWLSWFVFILIYCTVDVTPNMHKVAQWLFSSATFWLGYLLLTGVCILPEVAWLAFVRLYRPKLKDIVMEIERGYKPSGIDDEEDDEAAKVVMVRAHTPAPTGSTGGKATASEAGDDPTAGHQHTQSYTATRPTVRCMCGLIANEASKR